MYRPAFTTRAPLAGIEPISGEKRSADGISLGLSPVTTT
jgi:hypothetical protein